MSCEDKSFVKKILNNVVTFLGLIIGLLLTVALTVVGTGLGPIISDMLDLPGWVRALIGHHAAHHHASVPRG